MGEYAVTDYVEPGDPDAEYGVRLNPEKSRRITFTDEEELIVLPQS